MGEAPRGRGPTNGSGGKPEAPVVVAEITDLQLDARIRGEIDIQISTAKHYPRVVVEAMKQVEALALVDDETAASCYYTLARKDRESGEDKPIEGPSVRLAEIVASCWGHLRIEARQVGLNERFVTSRGAAWDLQTNNAWAFEVTRRITTRNGRTYSDDMISTTANAASAIALRNAVFKAVPSPFWRPIYNKCRELAMGSEADVQRNWKKATAAFEGEFKVTEAHLLAWLGIRDTKALQRVHIGRLRGLITALRDGDTTVDEAFAGLRIVEMPQRTNGGTTPTPASEPTPPPPAEEPAHDLITRLQKKETNGRPYWVVEIAGKKQAITFSTTIGAELEQWFMAGTPIAELVTHDTPDAKRPDVVWTYIDKVTAAAPVGAPAPQEERSHV